MSKKAFKAESKRLLELMIHSIYTHKEIFLRELISNASDASDKRYYQSVQNGEALNRDEMPIRITVDKEKRTLSIEDHGIGMSKEDLENNLGIIAKSGSLDFKNEMDKNDDIDIIGQFGVGFYSSFMVADQVSVLTKTLGGDAYLWESSGTDGYTISPAEKDTVGTIITLTIKKDQDEEQYDEFLEEYTLRHLIKKHSDYIRYPIQMEMEKSRPIEDKEGEFETYKELETLNSQTPIWKKKKAEVTQEEYNQFYKDKFFDFSDPIRTISTSTEGAATFEALLFVPGRVPMNYFSKDYQKGLQLYASGVLIMEHCADLLPDYFGFMRGIVDSQDLSLNISREMLQHDRQLLFIAKRLEKKIQSELLTMQKNQRKEYEEFFENFGVSLKYGVYESYGAHKEQLQDLLLFQSSNGGMTTLKEYVDRMREDQKNIYYASGDSVAQLENLPAAEAVREKGYEILYFTNQVDEFAIKMLQKYDEKEFRSVTAGNLDLETKEEKEEMEQQQKDSEHLLTCIKEHLGDKVESVTLSPRLKTHAVCLTAEGEITLEMEKTLNSMPGAMPVKAKRVLELNPNHPVFAKMTALFDNDKEKLSVYADLLYNQALLLEGLPLENPVAFADAISNLMA